jgi:hypothetical protein
VRVTGALMLLYGNADHTNHCSHALRPHRRQRAPPAHRRPSRGAAARRPPASAAAGRPHRADLGGGSHRAAARQASPRLRRWGSPLSPGPRAQDAFPLLPTRPSWNTALLALAADLPASVLSDTLGVSISAALQWTRRAARDWNTYLTSRSDQTPATGSGPF